MKRPHPADVILIGIVAVLTILVVLSLAACGSTVEPEDLLPVAWVQVEATVGEGPSVEHVNLLHRPGGSVYSVCTHTPCQLLVEPGDSLVATLYRRRQSDSCPGDSSVPATTPFIFWHDCELPVRVAPGDTTTVLFVGQVVDF